MKKGNLCLWLKRIGIGYLLYILIFGIAIYAMPSHVDKVANVDTYYGDTTGVDQVALIELPEDAFARRIEIIQHAKKELDICYHNLKAGESVDCFVAEIIQAANRGVKVRFVLDGTLGGLSGEHKDLEVALRAHQNIEYRPYNPIHLLKPWGWNVMLHDKFILADDELLLLGGRNIGDEYFAPPGYEDKVTHDRDVLVWNAQHQQESVLHDVKKYMDEIWNAKETKVLKPLNDKQMQKGKNAQRRILALRTTWMRKYKDYYYPEERFDKIMHPTNKITLIHNPLSTFKKEPTIGANMAHLLTNCKDIIIQTPYATANPYTLKALTKMNENGQVKMLTNSLGSTPNYPAFSNYYYQRDKFVDTNTMIYEYQSKDSIHGKSALADERLSMVGSFNLDDRSLYIDTESILVIDSEPFYQELKKEIDAKLEMSAKVNQDNEYVDHSKVVEVSTSKKVIMYFVSLFSRLFQFLI